MREGRLRWSPAAPEPGQHLWMSKAARRAVRQRVALATELSLHSVTLLGSVWTLHHPIERHQPKLRSANKQVEHGHRRRDLAPTSSMALMLQKSQPTQDRTHAKRTNDMETLTRGKAAHGREPRDGHGRTHHGPNRGACAEMGLASSCHQNQFTWHANLSSVPARTRFVSSRSRRADFLAITTT